MRPIKFRAWDKIHKRMLTVEQLYYPFWVQGYVAHGECDIKCKDFELMQFTGLYDVSGTRIFEGDLFDIGENNIYFIEYHNDRFCLSKYHKEEGFYRINIKVFAGDKKVIGNIMEHPHLLEKPK